MKIRPADVDSFIRKPDPAIRAALVYGPDDGLVRERASDLVRGAVPDPGDPFLVAELAGETIGRDRALLFDEAASISLTGGRRVVWIRDAGDAVAMVFTDFLADPVGDAFIVLQAGGLGPRSALRKLFETEANAAAIACYADDAQDLERLIDDTLRAESISVTPEARAWLAASLGSDRGVSRSELAKLAIYAGSGANVSLEDAQACVGDNAMRTLDGIALAAAGGDRAGLDRALAGGLAEGAPPVRVLRAVADHLLRLQRTAARLAAAMPPESALQGLRPPVFFKNKHRFLGQARTWSPAGLARALEIVLDAERLCKTTGTPDAAVCGRALLQIAALARRAER